MLNELAAKAAFMMVAQSTAEKINSSAKKLKFASVSIEDGMFCEFTEQIVNLNRLYKDLVGTFMELPVVSRNEVDSALNSIATLEASLLVIDKRIEPYYQASMN